jgi:hypothetical protein
LFVSETLAFGSGNQQPGPLAVRGFPIVIPKAEFVAVSLRMTTAHMMVDAVDPD